MTVKELQDALAEILNAEEALVQGGCKAFAEDSRDVYDKAQQWVSGGKVALVVVTPELTRNGSTVSEGTPVDAPILIRCVESAKLSGSVSGTLRALDAACLVKSALDGCTLEENPTGNLLFDSIRQTADAKSEIFTATARFFYSFTLT